MVNYSLCLILLGRQVTQSSASLWGPIDSALSLFSRAVASGVEAPSYHQRTRLIHNTLILQLPVGFYCYNRVINLSKPIQLTKEETDHFSFTLEQVSNLSLNHYHHCASFIIHFHQFRPHLDTVNRVLKSSQWYLSCSIPMPKLAYPCRFLSL